MCLGVLLGCLVTLLLARILLTNNNVVTANWFYPSFDALLAVTVSTFFSLYCVNRISKKFPDTNELLPFFGIIVWSLIILGYYVLRYNDKYQTALSVLATGSLAGMGWWIQFIISAASDRRKHTLNVVLSTRTCSEYQTHLRNYTRLWRGNRHVPKELCEWRADPDNVKFNNANVTDEVKSGLNGLLYILNFFEFLAQGIRANDLDHKLLRECFCGFMEELEKKAYFVITDAQKKDSRYFEGIVMLCKDWNNDKSLVEKYKNNNPPVDIGNCFPPIQEVRSMLGIYDSSPHVKPRRNRKRKPNNTAPRKSGNNFPQETSSTEMPLLVAGSDLSSNDPVK